MSKFVLKDRVQDATCYPTVGAVSLILRTTVGCRGQSRKAPALTTARTASPGVGRPFLYLPWPGKCGPEKGKACFSALYDRVFADWSQRLILPGPALAGASDQRGLVFLGGYSLLSPGSTGHCPRSSVPHFSFVSAVACFETIRREKEPWC